MRRIASSSSSFSDRSSSRIDHDLPAGRSTTSSSSPLARVELPCKPEGRDGRPATSARVVGPRRIRQAMSRTRRSTDVARAGFAWRPTRPGLLLPVSLAQAGRQGHRVSQAETHRASAAPLRASVRRAFGGPTTRNGPPLPFSAWKTNGAFVTSLRPRRDDGTSSRVQVVRRPAQAYLPAVSVVGPPGLEPGTCGLRVPSGGAGQAAGGPLTFGFVSQHNLSFPDVSRYMTGGRREDGGAER